MDDNIYINKWFKKIKAINLLGGMCCKCGEDSPFVISFHHIDPKNKDKNITELLWGCWDKIEEEIKKCIVLCDNCHREEHSSLKSKDLRKRNNKLICLEYKNIYKCSKCSYDKELTALEFHHKDDKNFCISNINIRMKSVNDLTNNIKEELDKCEVLCSNCHRKEKIDMKKFNSLKSLIYGPKTTMK